MSTLREVSKNEYEGVRREAEYVRSEWNKLRTVIGKHAVLMVDWISGAVDERIYGERLARIRENWFIALVGNRSDSYEPKGWSSAEDIDYRFRKLVEDMVTRFLDSIESGQFILPEDDRESGIVIYIHLSSSVKPAELSTVKHHFQQYVTCLARLRQVNDRQSSLFYQLATACILTGSSLGAFLDSVL